VAPVLLVVLASLAVGLTVLGLRLGFVLGD
jgi:hypothetical protein